MPQSIQLNGRIQTSGGRCFLVVPAYSDPIVVKCPGLGRTLLRDVEGIRVASGSPMVDIACDVTGRFLDKDYCSQNARVFGDLEAIVVYSQDGAAITVALDALSQLSQSELEDIEYFRNSSGPDAADEMKRRYLQARQAW